MRNKKQKSFLFIAIALVALMIVILVPIKISALVDSIKFSKKSEEEKVLISINEGKKLAYKIEGSWDPQLVVDTLDTLQGEIDLKKQYNEAYAAIQKAVQSKNQKDITVAMGLLEALPSSLDPIKLSLGAELDAAQKPILDQAIAAIEKARLSIKQSDINEARAYFVDMPNQLKLAYSPILDGIQNQLLAKAVEEAKEAQRTKSKEDYDSALALYNELLTVQYNEDLKLWVQTALKGEIDKISVKKQ